MEFNSRGKSHKAFKEIICSNGTIIGIFQGVKGDNPDLDIRICYKDRFTKGTKRTPKHIHWAIDLLIKKQNNRALTMEFIRHLQGMWDKIQPLKTKQEQQNIETRLSSKEELAKFEALNNYGEFSVDFIAYIIELFTIEEKTGMKDAFMFKKLLDALAEEKDIFSIVSTATFNGKLL